MPHPKLLISLVLSCGLLVAGAQAQESSMSSQFAEGAVGVSCSSKDGKVDCFCTGGCKRTQHDCSCTGLQSSTISNEMLRELLLRRE
ncbi:hypothetical protein [Oricola cellulosilytica]|uniref:Uncharacterized protein n=1 Tax=Oricola cellulosilytica TaxID=1429082 RepID=A0A4R0PA31_9HYPH|nr:hypothetical protein [Oricola cellulosilytica]TCD14111.1 hypothetical protein E0D97_08430 [Oricola cellulosilytica]